MYVVLWATSVQLETMFLKFWEAFVTVIRRREIKFYLFFEQADGFNTLLSNLHSPAWHRKVAQLSLDMHHPNCGA